MKPKPDKNLKNNSFYVGIQAIQKAGSFVIKKEFYLSAIRYKVGRFFALKFCNALCLICLSLKRNFCTKVDCNLLQTKLILEN